jgi:hypothetical protein
MQTIAVTAAFHDTASLFVDDLHLAVLATIVLVIAVEKRISLEELVTV